MQPGRRQRDEGDSKATWNSPAKEQSPGSRESRGRKEVLAWTSVPPSLTHSQYTTTRTQRSDNVDRSDFLRARLDGERDFLKALEVHQRAFHPHFRGFDLLRPLPNTLFAHPFHFRTKKAFILNLQIELV
ncbi:unnamed protein product, partial [Ixodes pacificus]